jgi:hypothetical protein
MALLIASLAEIAERPYKRKNWMEVIHGSASESMADDLANSNRNPLFLPLTPSEEPDPLLAGSTKALLRPLAHLWKYCKVSIYIPWPFHAWPIGLRHNLRPPTDPDSDTLLLGEDFSLGE